MLAWKKSAFANMFCSFMVRSGRHLKFMNNEGLLVSESLHATIP
jgi:hypothetical protein